MTAVYCVNLYSLSSLQGQLQAFLHAFQRRPVSLTVTHCFMETCKCRARVIDSWHRGQDGDSLRERQKGSSVKYQKQYALLAIWYGRLAQSQRRGLLRVLRHWSQASLKAWLLLSCLQKMMTGAEEHKKEGWLVCARHDTESEAASNSLFWRMRHWTLRTVLLERTSYK